MQQSIASCFPLYLARADLRPSSVRFKEQALKYFLKWFGDLPLDQVTSAIAEDYRTLLATEGRSKSCANGYLANFKPYFVWLQRHGRIAVNPFAGVRLYKLAERQKETFTRTELVRLLIVSDDLWRIRICLGLLGCRRGEMLALVVSDVHLDPPKPHVLLSEKKASPHSYAWVVKNHAIRYVALPEVMRFDGLTVELHRLIRERVASLPSDQPYVCLDDKYARKCFGRSVVYDPTANFQRMFRCLQRRAQIPNLRRYHELRAAFATAMIDAHGIARAAKALGHARIETTRAYDRKSELSLITDINKMAETCYMSNVP